MAVVRILEAGKPHWNSATNEEWTSDDPFERTPLIYRDAKAEVVRVVTGDRSLSLIEVRTVGGRVGDVTVTMDSEASLEEGQTYLLFLKRTDTPTREGTESAWTVVAGMQGVFGEAINRQWTNRDGLTFDGS